jgi:hypothetical protein
VSGNEQVNPILRSALNGWRDAMSETKWTPGPWRVGAAFEHDRGSRYWDVSVVRPDGWQSAVSAKTREDAVAVAGLIAAAPDLAAAAERVLDEIPWGRISVAARCALIDLRAALAKARGDS